jgi:hypothetical protein
MTNPLAQFRSGLFGNRGVDVAAALEYVSLLADASSDGVAVHTAARVLLNTVIGAVDQILSARSPEKIAITDLIDQRIESVIDQKISDWMDSNVDHENMINDWMSNNFDVTDYNLSDAVNDWMSDNLADKISDLDLVVRAR